ncbi:MAG: hypothetical protein ABIM29_05490 [candidate division WOR-3 bacterium]
MKNKRRKKTNKKFLILFLLIFLFAFLFKNKVTNLGAKKEYFEPICKLNENIFVNEEAKLMKMYKNLNLPYVRGNIEIVFNKKISSLYPCIEILKIIKKDFPEFFDSIECINLDNYKIIFKNKKVVTLGLGNFEEKLFFLFENYKYIKNEIDLKFLSFKKKED